MPGIVPPGKLFFRIFLRDSLAQKPGLPEGSGRYLYRLARPPEETNRREDNPAQIEAEERTSHRAGWERGDACAGRIDFGPNQAQ